MTRHDLEDLVLAMAVTGVSVGLTATVADDFSPSDAAVDWVALALVAVAGSALALRRRRPVAVAGVVTIAVTVYLLLGQPYGFNFLPLIVAVYGVGRYRPIREAGITGAAVLTVLLTHVFVHPDALQGWPGLAPASAWVVVPFAIGAVVRSTAESAAASRAEMVRNRLFEERLRIAQEVHDVVGHGLAAIQMQADVALHVDDDQPPRTREALEGISRASSSAFAELASALHVIRTEATLEPSMPGFADVEALCDRIRSTGVDVALSIMGRQQEISGEAGFAVYRVLQEALTNVIRHGREPRAEVGLVFGDGDVGLRVFNPGPADDTTPGSGLQGMRRRVASAGGTLTVGPVSGGYEVNARFPLEAR